MAWSVKKVGAGYAVVVDENGCEIAMHVDIDDADVIAAAPEMREALREMLATPPPNEQLSTSEEWKRENAKYERARSRAEAALRKARGEANPDATVRP